MNCMMLLLVVIWVVISVSTKSFAHFDFSTAASLRSYPSMGAEVSIESGYNFKLWGNGPGADKKRVLYGLLRPAINLGSSAVINSYDARVELYPISFIALVLGQKNINSDFDEFTFFDCQKVRCKGSIKRDYTQFKMALGFWKILAMANIVASQNTYSHEDNNRDQQVAEFRFAALANPEEDKMYRSQYVLAFKHSKKGLFGVLAEYVKFEDSEQSHNMDLIIYTTRPQRTTYVFGLGQFSSTHQEKGIIGVFQMKTDLLSSSKMF